MLLVFSRGRFLLLIPIFVVTQKSLKEVNGKKKNSK